MVITLLRLVTIVLSGLLPQSLQHKEIQLASDWTSALNLSCTLSYQSKIMDPLDWDRHLFIVSHNMTRPSLKHKAKDLDSILLVLTQLMNCWSWNASYWDCLWSLLVLTWKLSSVVLHRGWLDQPVLGTQDGLALFCNFLCLQGLTWYLLLIEPVLGLEFEFERSPVVALRLVDFGEN